VIVEDWVLAALSVPPKAAEAAGGALFESGAGGVWEDRPDDLGRTVLKAGFPQGAEMRLMAELPAALEAMAREFGIAPSDMALTLELKPGEDYGESWKKDLAPIEIDPSLIISPSWWTGPMPGEPGARILMLDPGSAFGSGHHPSTFLCLRLMRELAARDLLPGRILDLGSGSGVLALAAALVWPEASVEAVDDDPDTLWCARLNFGRNSPGARIDLKEGSLDQTEGEFDLILANLTLNTLTELARALSRRTRVPGRLILSGILAEQAPELIETMRPYDFVCESHLGRGEWSALSLIRGLPAVPDEERRDLDPPQEDSLEDPEEDSDEDPGEAPPDESLEDPEAAAGEGPVSEDESVGDSGGLADSPAGAPPRGSR
jgi:ribosomal protein L11 methyltransferase